MTAQENLTTIEPVNGPLVGSISVPGDKSISHRAVLFAAMAEGTSRLSGVLDSEDVRSSLGAVSKLGAKVNLEKLPMEACMAALRLGREGPQHTERANRLRQFRHHDALAHGNFGPVGY